MQTATARRLFDDATTMHEVVTRYLVGDQPRGLDRIIFLTAIAIEGEWSALDHIERMTVDTMLAWAVVRDAKMVSILDIAHERTQSPWSLRRNVTVGTDGTADGLCKAIAVYLGEMREARMATANGTAAPRCEALLKEMQVAHPRLGLSFGYIGNCGMAPGSFDDRKWSFFTKLATPSCARACNVSFGGHTTAYLGKLTILAEKELAAWCDEQERRLDAGEIRVVTN